MDISTNMFKYNLKFKTFECINRTVAIELLH